MYEVGLSFCIIFGEMKGGVKEGILGNALKTSLEASLLWLTEESTWHQAASKRGSWRFITYVIRYIFETKRKSAAESRRKGGEEEN